MNQKKISHFFAKRDGTTAPKEAEPPSKRLKTQETTTGKFPEASPCTLLQDVHAEDDSSVEIVHERKSNGSENLGGSRSKASKQHATGNKGGGGGVVQGRSKQAKERILCSGLKGKRGHADSSERSHQTSGLVDHENASDEAGGGPLSPVPRGSMSGNGYFDNPFVPVPPARAAGTGGKSSGQGKGGAGQKVKLTPLEQQARSNRVGSVNMCLNVHLIVQMCWIDTDERSRKCE
jgi:hypothetical protein